MRVAYFTESIPPMTDGVSRTLDGLFRYLPFAGVDFRVFAPVRPSSDAPWASKVHQGPSVSFPLYDYYRLSIPTAPWSKALDAFGPDLVHVTAPSPAGYFALNYASVRGLPAVSSYHTHFAAYFKYYGFGFAESMGWEILKGFHNRGAFTFVPSAGTVEELRTRGFRNLRVWGRGVDLGIFSPEFRDEEWRKRTNPAGGPLFLFVGRLVKEKDLDDLAEAVRILRQKGRRFGVVVVGEGPYREEAQRRMPNAHFTGLLRGTELARIYASCDIFAFPSTTETFGNVVQEAFASGLPAVVARKGGPTDLVREGVNGFTATPNRPLEFASALERLIEEPGLQQHLSKGALATVRRSSWGGVHRSLVRAYDQLVPAVSVENAPDVIQAGYMTA